MSNRHRSKQAAANHQAPSKEERKAANRKARHRTHELLAHTDIEAGEDIVAPEPKHTRIDAEKEAADERSPKPRREYRHWKQKFWKRRNNERARKAAMEASDELPLRDVS